MTDAELDPQINITDELMTDGTIFSVALKVTEDGTTISIVTPAAHDNIVAISMALPEIWNEVVEALTNAHDLAHAEHELEGL